MKLLSPSAKLPTSGQGLGHAIADVVPGPLVLPAGIAQSNDQLHGQTYFFSAPPFFSPAAGAAASPSPSFSILPLAITSGSAAPSMGTAPGTGSATICTSRQTATIASGSFMALTLG